MPKASRTAHRLSTKPVPISKSSESEAATFELFYSLTGKVKYVLANGSSLSVKCHHSESSGLKP